MEDGVRCQWFTHLQDGRAAQKIRYSPLTSSPPNTQANLSKTKNLIVVIIGDIVRIGPNALSFTTVEAYRVIYGHVEHNKKRFLKSVMYEREEPRIVSARDPTDHAMQRRALSHAFSAQALRNQEKVVHQYVDLLIEQLGNLGDNGRKGVNVTDAYNWLTVDLIGKCTQWIFFFLGGANGL